MNKKTPLTQLQRRFAQNYALSLDATQSAINAGYKASSVHIKANELLKNPAIISEIHAQIEDSANSLQVSNPYIIKKLLQIITSTSENEPVLDKQGNPTGANKLKDAAVALRAVDCLARFLQKETPEKALSNDDSAVRIMCIENLNEDKI